MNCETVGHALEGHLEDGLLPIDSAAVTEHLRGCPACAGDVVRSRALTRALDALPDPPVPSAFTQSVMQQLPEMLPAAQGAGHVVRWGVATAASVFAFLAGLALLLDGAGPDIAHEVLDPMVASLRLAGMMLGHGATMAAALLDAASTALVMTEVGTKLAFAAVFVATNATLFAVVARYRMALGPAAASASASAPRR